MNEKFVGWLPQAASKKIVDQAEEICAEYTAQGYDLTLRQLYYQFVSRGLIENNQRSYKRLGDVINNARMGGWLDWQYIVDRTRNLAGPSHWDSPEDVVLAAAQSYRIDKRADQEIRVEVWVEKEALAGVVGQAARGLDIDYFSCRGYVSQSEQHAAAERFQRYIEGGQKVVVVHLGDHDPSGIDMTRDIEERIRRFLAVGLGWTDPDTPLDPSLDREHLAAAADPYYADQYRDEGFVDYGEDVPVFQVRRIALNWDQVQLYKPPPNPAKLTDSRVGSYLRRFGDKSWELDALDPAVMELLITDEVLRWTNAAKFEALRQREAEERGTLAAISRNYSRLTWPEE